MGQVWHKTKRPGLGLSHKAFSRSALLQVLLNDRIGAQLFQVNGTAVPYDITFRPFSNNYRWHNLYPLAVGQVRER
jgi:hypothetical protein